MWSCWYQQEVCCWQTRIKHTELPSALSSLCQRPKEQHVAESSPKAALPLKMCISAGILCLQKRKKPKKSQPAPPQNPPKNQTNKKKRELKKRPLSFPFFYSDVNLFVRRSMKSICQEVVAKRIAKPRRLTKLEMMSSIIISPAEW